MKNRKSYQNDTVRKLDELILRKWKLSSIRVIFNYTKWVGPKSSHTICFSIYMWKSRLQVFLFAAAYFVLCGCGKANYEENDIVFSSDKEVYWVVLQPRKQCLLCLYKWQVLTVVVHVGLQRRFWWKKAYQNHNVVWQKNSSAKHQAPVVRRVDNAIHWINLYTVDTLARIVNSYPLDEG